MAVSMPSHYEAGYANNINEVLDKLPTGTLPECRVAECALRALLVPEISVGLKQLRLYSSEIDGDISHIRLLLHIDEPQDRAIPETRSKRWVQEALKLYGGVDAFRSLDKVQQASTHLDFLSTYAGRINDCDNPSRVAWIAARAIFVDGSIVQYSMERIISLLTETEIWSQAEYIAVVKDLFIQRIECKLCEISELQKASDKLSKRRLEQKGLASERKRGRHQFELVTRDLGPRKRSTLNISEESLMSLQFNGITDEIIESFPEYLKDHIQDYSDLIVFLGDVNVISIEKILEWPSDMHANLSQVVALLMSMFLEKDLLENINLENRLCFYNVISDSVAEGDRENLRSRARALHMLIGYNKGEIKSLVEEGTELLSQAVSAIQSTFQDNPKGWEKEHFAVLHGSLESLKLFVTLTDEIGKLDSEGNTLLHLAVLHKQTSIIKFLMSKMDQTQIDYVNKEGKTAHQLAEEMV